MKKQFVVLGGGFAGLEAAIKLRGYGHEVCLVSNRDYMFIYPVSIWIPTGKKKFEEVQLKLSDLQKKHGFEVVVDEVTRIDVDKNQVILANRVIEYQYLFVAMGMHKMDAPGLEYTHSICGKPLESLAIKEELERLAARGHGKIAVGFGSNPKDSTATAVRGGPAFELLFNISHYLKKKGLLEQFELNFFAPMKEPGRRMGEKPYLQMDVFFKHYQVKKHIGKAIQKFEENAVVFNDESRLESDLTIFIPAGDGHKIIKESTLPLNEAGFIKINELCRVKGYKNVYAIGDVAEIAGPKWAAKQGHIAEVMANVAAYNAHQEFSGKGKRKSYWEKLHIICVMDSGDGAAFIMRTHNREFILPLPIVGHWLKKAWGFYFKNTKLKRIPRMPGM
jgi:sulfide:quinone oxidoreductase